MRHGMCWATENHYKHCAQENVSIIKQKNSTNERRLGNNFEKFIFWFISSLQTYMDTKSVAPKASSWGFAKLLQQLSWSLFIAYMMQRKIKMMQRKKFYISCLSVTQFLVFYNYLDCLGSSNCRQTQIASLKVLIKQKFRRCNLDKLPFFKKCISVTDSRECEKCFVAFREKKIV